MDRDWARLGSALQNARQATEPPLRQEDVAKRLGVSRTTVQNIERGKVYARVQPVHREYGRLVGWSTGSVDRVLAGGDPVMREGQDEGDFVPMPASLKSGDLPARVVHELERDGQLIEATVIRLTPDATLTAVVRGRPDASPEEIRRSVRAWLEAQERIDDTGA